MSERPRSPRSPRSIPPARRPARPVQPATPSLPLRQTATRQPPAPADSPRPPTRSRTTKPQTQRPTLTADEVNSKLYGGWEEEADSYESQPPLELDDEEGDDDADDDDADEEGDDPSYRDELPPEAYQDAADEDGYPEDGDEEAVEPEARADADMAPLEEHATWCSLADTTDAAGRHPYRKQFKGWRIKVRTDISLGFIEAAEEMQKAVREARKLSLRTGQRVAPRIPAATIRILLQDVIIAWNYIDERGRPLPPPDQGGLLRLRNETLIGATFETVMRAISPAKPTSRRSTRR